MTIDARATDIRATGAQERSDLLQSLSRHRELLLRTVEGLSDEQARLRSTASELCLGGVLKHVAIAEEGWAAFIIEGPGAIGPADEGAYEAHAAGFDMGDATVPELVARYGEVARRTDDLVTSLAPLDVCHPLPEAPWFEPGAHWSALRVLLHIIAETAQHAGHADIIRESIDGAKTMG